MKNWLQTFKILGRSHDNFNSIMRYWFYLMSVNIVTINGKKHVFSLQIVTYKII